MKKVSALIIIIAVLFAANYTYSQNALTIHVTGGYNVPLPDLKGKFPDDLTKNPVPLFMKNGFNIGADGKYYVDKKLRSFGITLSFAYNGFSSGDLADSAGTVFGSSKFNSITLGLGVEYRFLTKKKAHPFIGAEFTGNFLSGKFTPAVVDSINVERTLKSASRFGLAFGVGVDIKLSKNVGVVIGGKYALLNLIGKKAPDSTEVLGTNEYALYDKSYTTAGGVTVNSLNLSYLQLYGGVSFYLMQPKKIVKKK